MARALRIEIPGGTYHITARGNARGFIYRDDVDRRAYLTLLEKTLSRCAWTCLAYCLMSNHYHLVIETSKPNLSAGMRWLNSTYAQGFNRRSSRSGHLFQGRYKALLVERESHFAELLRYVARNPVKAGLCTSAAQWPWSSHREILGLTRPGFVARERVLAEFGTTEPAATAAYAAFVDRDSAYRPATGKLAVDGPADFRREHLPQERPSPQVPYGHWRGPRPSLSSLVASGTSEEIFDARSHGYKVAEIASAVGCHRSTINRRMKTSEDATF